MPKGNGANVVATANYAMFEQAESWHMSMRQMLSGVPGPLTLMERYLWWRYYTAKARIRQQERMAGRG